MEYYEHLIIWYSLSFTALQYAWSEGITNLLLLESSTVTEYCSLAILQEWRPCDMIWQLSDQEVGWECDTYYCSEDLVRKLWKAVQLVWRIESLLQVLWTSGRHRLFSWCNQTVIPFILVVCSVQAFHPLPPPPQ